MSEPRTSRRGLPSLRCSLRGMREVRKRGAMAGKDWRGCSTSGRGPPGPLYGGHAGPDRNGGTQRLIGSVSVAAEANPTLPSPCWVPTSVLMSSCAYHAPSRCPSPLALRPLLDLPLSLRPARTWPLRPPWKNRFASHPAAVRPLDRAFSRGARRPSALRASHLRRIFIQIAKPSGASAGQDAGWRPTLPTSGSQI